MMLVKYLAEWVTGSRRARNNEEAGERMMVSRFMLYAVKDDRKYPVEMIYSNHQNIKQESRPI
jgi:hypothetical protein